MKHLIAALALTAILAPSAQAEDIMSILERQAKIERAAPPALNPYNYTIDITAWGKEGKDKTLPFTAKLLIDPSAAPEVRVTIMSASNEDYPEDVEKLLKGIQDPKTTPEDLAEEFWCEGGDDSFMDRKDFSLDDFTVISETASEAVIRPDLALMAEVMMNGEDEEDMSKSERRMTKKMMKRLDGEFTLSKPDAQLKNMKIWLTRPMTVAVIAKIKEMEISQSCALAPNGFTYTDNMTMRVKAKALGVGMEQNMDIKVSGLTLR